MAPPPFVAVTSAKKAKKRTVKRSAKGDSCSPLSATVTGNDGGTSCYTKAQLVSIARAINAKYGLSIPVSGTKKVIWNAIDTAMSQQCTSEFCWAEQVATRGPPSSITDDAAASWSSLVRMFRAKKPKPHKSQDQGAHAMLKTSDIHKVLKQYEDVYPEFVALGPYSIDFCDLGEEVCNINLWTMKNRRMKTKIGIVFNTDPSTKDGKHWVSMFIDVSAPSPSEWEINYFDSFGHDGTKMPKQIRRLIDSLRAVVPAQAIVKSTVPRRRSSAAVRVKGNCSRVNSGNAENGGSDEKYCTTTKVHQTSETECGMYSIYFIVKRLEGKSYEDLVVRNTITDRDMYAFRNKVFHSTRK
jgi:hypothetical protein